MKIRDIMNEDGRIVKGVNTTVDVKPGETERQAAKFFGNKGKPKPLDVGGATAHVAFNLGLVNESYKLQLERGDGMDILHILDTKTGHRTEVRGKPNFEIEYDPNDPLHKVINSLGKSANISDFVNGEVVTINPKHPDSTKAQDATNRAFNEATMKISDLTLSDAGMAIAHSAGGGSKTDAPIAVTKLPSGHVYVVNGYHRVVDAMNAGKDSIEVEYHPFEKVEILWKNEREEDIKYGKKFNEEVEISLHGDAKKGYVLSKIEVSGDERNSGQGTKAMQDIVDRMDREGAIIALTPDDSFGGNKTRLIKFYKRFGFVPNKGRNKDFRFRETMIRYPKKMNEAFDTKLDWKKQGTSYTAKIGDKTVTIDYDEKPIYTGEKHEMGIEVNFSVDGRYDVTGTGDANAVFGAVYNHIAQWVGQVKPEVFEFSASKRASDSRASLYARMVKRFAQQLGYTHHKAASKSVSSSIGDTFVLLRNDIAKKRGIAEHGLVPMYDTMKAYGMKRKTTNGQKHFVTDDLDERKLTKKEIKKRDRLIDELPDAEFKKRYGKDWEAVKYGTATNMAKESEEIEENIYQSAALKVLDNIAQRRDGQAHPVKFYDGSTLKVKPETARRFIRFYDDSDKERQHWIKNYLRTKKGFLELMSPKFIEGKE